MPDVHGAGWSPSVTIELSKVLCGMQDVFSSSETDSDSLSLVPF